MEEREFRRGGEFAGYRIEALLRRSGSGVVYHARDLRLDRPVALRLLDPGASADKAFRERFRRESRLAGSLEHASIVPVYETGEADGQLFVATRFVEGVDLASLIEREERLELEHALAIVGQLADALDAARWSRSLVHGSLTPSEVLVTPGAGTTFGERVFLSGFGLRRELSVGTTLDDAAVLFGTVDYLAPEQIEGKPVSPRTDVYALGCLLFTCLTGTPPFRGDSALAVLRTHLYEQPPLASQRRPGLPAGIDRVLQKAMAKWPEERYSTCAELAAAAQSSLAPGEKQPGQAQRERISPVELPARSESRAPEEPPARALKTYSAAGPDSLAQRLGRRWKPLGAIGLALLAVLVTGVVWLTRSGADDVSSATPPPPTAEAADGATTAEGAGAAAPPTETEALAEPQPQGDPPGEPIGYDSPPPVLSPLPGSLIRIDAATGEILARVAIPFPKLLASDGRSVWVLSDEGASEKLVRVEVATNVVAEIFDADVAGVMPTQLAAVGGSAWLDLARLYRFAPGASAGRPARIEADSPWFQGPVAAAGSLWVRNGEGGGELLRVNPVTRRIMARLAPADEVVAASDGFLWALSWEGNVLVRINTETNDAVPISRLELEWADFAVAGGAVWASSPGDATIVRLDPVTGEEQERIRVGRRPGALAAGGGAVWAATSSTGSVVRYDIAANGTTRIDVGGWPTDLVYARGSIWVAVEELGGGGKPLSRAEYIAKADAICRAATDRFEAAVFGLSLTAPENQAAWTEAAVRFSEQALAELHALPAPKTGRAHFIEFYSLLERQTDILRQAAEVASAGDFGYADALGRERVEVTHQKDALEPRLQWCPVSLPA